MQEKNASAHIHGLFHNYLSILTYKVHTFTVCLTSYTVLYSTCFKLSDFGKKYMNTTIYFWYLQYIYPGLSLSWCLSLYLSISLLNGSILEAWVGTLSPCWNSCKSLIMCYGNSIPLRFTQSRGNGPSYLAEPALLHGCIAKTLYRKFETNIPRKETARLQSQFLHLCFCAWAIYIFPRSVCLFCCRKIGGLIMGIYKSLTGRWKWKLGLKPHSFISGNT
jgi:hypothetical protein